MGILLHFPRPTRWIKGERGGRGGEWTGRMEVEGKKEGAVENAKLS